MVGGGPDVGTIDGGGTRVRGSVAAVALPLVKFFKHSGPSPNPTRTDNNDNSDNVAQCSRPSSVHTHLPSKPTHSPRLPAACSVTHRGSPPAGHALRPAHRHLRSAAAAALCGARRGEGLEGEELLRHECGRPVERLVDAVAPAQAALKVGLSAQRRIRHTDGCDAPQTEARHFAHENEPEPPLDRGRGATVQWVSPLT